MPPGGASGGWTRRARVEPNLARDGEVVAGAEAALQEERRAAAADVVDLSESDTATGDFTFANDGTEQDALAEYLGDNFPTTGTEAFSEEDTAAEEDTVIINLSL